MARHITPNEWGRMIANAWIDPAYAEELSADPVKAARRFLKLDPHSDVRFEIPAKPADLSLPQLEDIRSGKTVNASLARFSC